MDKIYDGMSKSRPFLRYLPLVIIAAVVAYFWPFRSVPTGHRGVMTQFGAIKSVEPEGLVIVAPWRNLTVFSIRSESAEVDEAEGATSDTQPVKVSLTVRYAIFPDKVAEVYEQYTHNGDLSSYVQTATQEVFKAVTARYSAPDLIAQRAKVSGDIKDALTAKLSIYGAKVVNIDMRSFSFSPEYMKAINEKVTQEQLRLVAENKLLTVESEQKQKVAIAEAEASAAKAEADGQAYARIKLAEAEANALKQQGQALAQNPQVLELRKIEVEKIKAEKWGGVLPQSIFAGAPVPFFDVSRSGK